MLIDFMEGSNAIFLTATNEANQTTAVLMQVGMFAIIGLLFYFFLIRPQKKKEKETIVMRKNIQIGDEIMTIGGIVGIVLRKTEDTVVIETGGEKTKLRIKMWAVQENITAQEAAAREKELMKVK